MKSADFSKNLPLKILQNLTFFRENPAKSADFSTNFDFLPAKPADFSVNLPPKIPRNFVLFEISEALVSQPFLKTQLEVEQNIF